MNQSWYVRISINGIFFDSICGMTLSAAEDLIKEYKITHPDLNCYIVPRESAIK